MGPGAVRIRRRLLTVLAAAMCLAAAPDPAERLSDPREEARARALFQETRCLVCQGQSIDDSDSDLAGDLRRAIRGQVSAGASDAQVRAFLRARFGDFVLLRPPLSAPNAPLWIAPFAIAGAGILALWWRARGRGGIGAAEPHEPDLSAEEEARLARLTNEEDASAGRSEA
jgi:cytochrome c-type biogenesis protein CcmH